MPVAARGECCTVLAEQCSERNTHLCDKCPLQGLESFNTALQHASRLWLSWLVQSCGAPEHNLLLHVTENKKEDGGRESFETGGGGKGDDARMVVGGEEGTEATGIVGRDGTWGTNAERRSATSDFARGLGKKTVRREREQEGWIKESPRWERK